MIRYQSILGGTVDQLKHVGDRCRTALGLPAQSIMVRRVGASS